MFSLFTQARIRLTIWYTLMIMVFTVSASVLFYFRTARVLEIEHTRMEHRFLRQFDHLVVPGLASESRSLFLENLNQTKRNILVQLLLINLCITCLFAISGYVLAGKTLEPIDQALRTQKQFTADAAHELKTPVTALRTSLEVGLLDKSHKKTTRDLLGSLLEDVTHIQRMIERLLSLARHQENRQHFVPLSLEKVVMQAVKMLAPVARSKQIKLETQCISDLRQVSGDPDALQEVVVILVDNAIKYSPAGSSISIKLEQDRKYVRLEVSDAGIGIDPRDVPKIFDRFYRADLARCRGQSCGYGLGLAVAKKIIEEHRGQITVKSELGKGSTFMMRLSARLAAKSSK